MARLKRAGIDVETAERSGQLEVLPWEQAHVVDGCFDQHRMLANLDKRFAADNEHYEVTRLWSNHVWALQDLPGVTDIIEYESRFNLIWPEIRRHHRLRLRGHQIQCRGDDGDDAHTSVGDRGLFGTRKSVLCAAGTTAKGNPWIQARQAEHDIAADLWDLPLGQGLR